MLSLTLSRMGLLLPLVLSMLATPCMLAYVPEQVLRPSLLAHGCNNSDVLAVAGFALQDLNSNRKDGYVLSLNRVNNVQEHRQDALGSVYYLTLDVLETDCHVLSKKDWRDCGERILQESVYGQCKAIIYVNKPRRILYSPAYNCTLRPVSRRKIHRMCPDCPSSRSSPIDLSDPSVREAATESLAKYNKESPLKLYSLVKVTRASSQWVFGPSYFVEYLIRELPCIKSPEAACILEIPDSPPVGICKGSLSKSGLEKFVSVSCNFFEPQGLVRILPVQEPQQRNTAFAHSPSEVAPKGSVQHLPDLENEQSEDSKGKDPVEAFPVQLDLTTNPQGETLDVSFLFLGPMKETLVVLPFPKEEQRSAECPGPAKMADPLVLPP